MKKQLTAYLLIAFSFFIFLGSCKQEVKKEKVNLEARSEIIDAKEINQLLKSGKNVAFKNSTITGDIDFAKFGNQNIELPGLVRSTIKSSVTFMNCTFKGKLIGQKSDSIKSSFTTFNKNLTFVKCTFQDELVFKETVFTGIVIFRDSEFYGKTDFTGAVFNFEKNYFSKDKFFAPANFAF